MSLVKLSMVLALAAAAESEAPILDALHIAEPPRQRSGRASWYGDGQMHGLRTANGERIDPDRHTCAHRDLPFGTVVLLVNRDDPKRRTWCRINDRGPFGARDERGERVLKRRRDEPGRWVREIDIALAAARELVEPEAGVVNVDVHYWKRRRR